LAPKRRDVRCDAGRPRHRSRKPRAAEMLWGSTPPQRAKKENMDRDGGHGKETDSYSDDAEEEAADAELRNGK
jgi:hypothetical protein